MDFLADIKKENKTLYDYIFSQINIVSKQLDNVQNVFHEYTDHSSNHSKSVLQIGEKLNSAELNIFEKAIFVLSAYFHDVGMNVSQSEIDKYMIGLEDNLNLDYYMQQITESQELENASIDETKKYIALDHFREQHNNLSADYIKISYPKVSRDSYIGKNYLWDYVAKICRAHTYRPAEIRLDDNYSTVSYLEDHTQINVLYLSLLLRLADICHFSKDRAYPYFLKDKHFGSKKSKNICESHSNIVATIPDKESNTIKVQADCNNVHIHRAIINDTKYIQKELMNCHELLVSFKSKHQFEWKFVDTSMVRPSQDAKYRFNDFRFNLNNDKIVDLLMGEKLYSNKLYAIRECIQNSVDAIKVFSKNISSTSYIYINYYNSYNPILEVFDSGTGMNMDIISNNFLSIGSNSFWRTEKGMKEWKLNYKSMDLIADHGIGALSYFMIAKQIEIFTKYQKNNDFIHVIIDDFKDSIICKETSETDFPKFSSAENIPTPWFQMHGTCIRFILKEELKFDQLIKFLSINILRCPIDLLILNYNSIEYPLNNIWHFRDKYDSYTYPKDRSNYFSRENDIEPSNELSPIQIVEEFYKEEYDQYSLNPPQDRAVDENFINLDNIWGRINLNYWNSEYCPCRISQNGILIKNAIDFISNNKQSDFLLTAYGFDIDIKSTPLFQLDAERTTIINNKYNKEIFEKIEQLLDEQYFNQIPKIQSSIYFHCGGSFYHGITDIIFKHDDSIKCFNENFRRIFPNDIIIKHQDKLRYFNSAKLYMTGLSRCVPVSINDLLVLSVRDLIIPKLNKLTTKNLTRTSNGQKYVDINKLKEKINVDINENTIYLADNEHPFMLHLYENFNFIKQKENDFIYHFHLNLGKMEADNEIRIELERMWGNK